MVDWLVTHNIALSAATLLVSLVGLGLSCIGMWHAINEVRRVQRAAPAFNRRWSDRLLNEAHRRIAALHLIREFTVFVVQGLLCLLMLVAFFLPNIPNYSMSPQVLAMIGFRKVTTLAISITLSSMTLWMRLEWGNILDEIDAQHTRHEE